MDTLDCDSDNNTLMIGYTFGLDIFNADTGEWQYLDEDDGLATDWVSQAAVIGDETWVVSSFGVSVIHADGSITPYDEDIGNIPEEHVAASPVTRTVTSGWRPSMACSSSATATGRCTTATTWTSSLTWMRSEGADQVMVVSTRPIVLGNDPGDDNAARYEKIAFVGQVEVKVRGPVAAGNFIVPSGLEDGSGVAVAPEAITPEQFAQIVGRAWEDAAGPGLKRVRVAVGLIQYGPNAAHIQALEAENAVQQAQIDELESRLAVLEAALAALQAQGQGDE